MSSLWAGIVIFICIAFLSISFRAVFYAFVKRKDERSKWIVVKSMADSFIVLIILQSILLAIKWVNYDFYQVWWSNFKEGIYIEPIMLSLIIFGLILIVNTKRNGGSL